MKFLLVNFFLLSCSPLLLNSTIGFKRVSDNSSEKKEIIFVKPKIYYSKSFLNIHESQISESIQVSIENSNRYKVIEEIDEVSKLKTGFLFESHIKAIEKVEMGYYPYNKDLFFLYFPAKNREDGKSIFWPTFIPSLYPYFTALPFTAKSLKVNLTFELRIYKDGVELKRIIKEKEEDYSLLIYGIYRVGSSESDLIKNFESILEELTLELVDLELETTEKVEPKTKKIKEKNQPKTKLKK